MTGCIKYAVSLFISIAVTSTVSGQCDTSAEEKRSLHFVKSFIKDSVFINAVEQISNAVFLKPVEYCIAFGKGSSSGYITSIITEGNYSSGRVPALAGAFTDLHNHINELPPDAGDLYGLLSICKRYPCYNTRFVKTGNGMLYSLIIVNWEAAIAFNEHYPAQKTAAPGLQPAFPEKIVDEFRKLKYLDLKTDEQAFSYILKKYNTGVLLVNLY